MKIRDRMGEAGEGPSGMLYPNSRDEGRSESAESQITLNHHIWNNNGTLWLNATIFVDDMREERVRESLKTKDIVTARRRRDQRLAELSNQSGIELCLSLNKSRAVRNRYLYLKNKTKR